MLEGLVCYDLVHYYLHHGMPSSKSDWHYKKVAHTNHHFKDFDNSLWKYSTELQSSASPPTFGTTFSPPSAWRRLSRPKFCGIVDVSLHKLFASGLACRLCEAVLAADSLSYFAASFRTAILFSIIFTQNIVGTTSSEIPKWP